MDDEREKTIMKEAKNALASLMSSLDLGSEEMSNEEFCAVGKGEIC